MTSAEDVQNNITNLTNNSSNTLAFHINGGVNGEESDGLVVIFNSKDNAADIELPEGQWTVYINGEDAGTTPLGTAEGSVTVDPISAMVLVKEPNPEPEATEGTVPDASSNSPMNTNLIWIIAGVCALVILGFVLVLVKRRRS
jgi:hypothetical protein